MVSVGQVSVFDSLPDGKSACFGVLDRRGVIIQALVQDRAKFSLDYSEMNDADSVNRITVRSPPESPIPIARLARLFEGIRGENALFAIEMPETGGAVALPASMMQRNSLGLTANAMLARKETDGSTLTQYADVIPAWLVREIGADITIDAMMTTVCGSVKKDRAPPLVPQEPISPALPERAAHTTPLALALA